MKKPKVRIDQDSKTSMDVQKPKDADLCKPREWNDYTWHYCSPGTGGKCKGLYRIHKPSECRSKQSTPEKKRRTEGKGGKSREVIINEVLSELREKEDDFE